MRECRWFKSFPRPHQSRDTGVVVSYRFMTLRNANIQTFRYPGPRSFYKRQNLSSPGGEASGPEIPLLTRCCTEMTKLPTLVCLLDFHDSQPPHLSTMSLVTNFIRQETQLSASKYHILLWSAFASADTRNWQNPCRPDA